MRVNSHLHVKDSVFESLIGVDKAAFLFII